MEELIFFGIIIFFSILESIARSRKAKKGEGDVEDQGPLPDPREWEGRLPELELPEVEGSGRASDGDLPTYDDDPSYDDVATKRSGRRDSTLERYRAPQGTDQAPRGPSGEETRRPSSETMLPGDLLEQLEGLARGRQQQRDRPPRRTEGRRRGREEERQRTRTLDLPDQSPPLPAPIERTEVGSGRGVTGPVGSTSPVGSRAPIGSRPVEHEIHRSHAGYGTDPSSRAPSEQDGLDPLAERLGAEGVAVRRMLLGSGRSALRQAVVLKEVLGPPLALRTGAEPDR